MSKLKILFLEDVEEDAELVARALRSEGLDFELTRVDTKDDFFKAIRLSHFDIILSDHSLPQFNSAEALKLCKRLGITAPFILVTGSVSEEFAITRIKQGADDYILKSNLSRLHSAILNSLNTRKLAAQRLEAEIALRIQNEELTKINSELDSFAYSVSHDLRAPLRSLLGLLNISKRDSRPRDPVYDKYFEMMELSVSRLDATLKEILEHSRNARFEVVKDDIDFLTLINTCISKLEYLDGFNEVNISIEVNGDFSHFVSDAYRICVVIENLLSNAIKYRDPSKQKCELAIEVVQIDDHEAELCFSDNGLGIAPDLTGKVFDMFFRGNTKSDGAGLGLYIVREAVAKLNGKIIVQSELGKGATFKVSIPNLKN